jgi:hypothetical protein
MSSEQNELETLTEIFRNAGAKNPELWARSQVNEGINQLARFSFLKAISSEWLNESEVEWIDSQINYYYGVGDPCSQLQPALKEMVDKGVRKEAILDLIRVIQYKTLYQACATIDNVYESDAPVSNWALYEQDEDCNPVNTIGGLHESLLQFDPSGNEMRPRKENGSS